MPNERMRAWFEATATRRSRRRYLSQPVEDDTLDALAATCEGFHPHADARVALVEQPTSDVFTGVLGSYGKVTGSPHVLCVIADETSPTAQHHAGYVGEAAVLEATALGLNTCWIGGFFDQDKAARMVRLSANEDVVAVSPVGVASENLSGAERAMRKLSSAHKRKSLTSLASDDITQWPAWALAALECARIAPSAVNRQPWCFHMEDGALVISRDSPVELPRVTKALDCGIAMLHAELGAFSAGVLGGWEDLESKSILARFVVTREVG